MKALTKKTSSGFGSYDAACCRDVVLALAATGYPELREVSVAMHEGLVTLRGRANTYYAKQLAQEAARRIDGVEALRNEIVVHGNRETSVR
ncbi:MAG: BON domain-containing protein [Planctomycetaceae bacterium]